jgi:lysophospholipase L1-like esterase
MRTLHLCLLAGFLLMAAPGYSQATMAIVGSSTSACTGPSSTATCYVGRLRTFYNQQPPSDTTIDNGFAVGGYNCYRGMPSSYIPPYSEPSRQPDPAHNITAALAINPDVVLVNYPTNDYDVLRIDSIMYCLRTIRDSANKKGVPCFVTSTQPRTAFNAAGRAKLKELHDSIMQEMGFFAVDFWTGIADPADYSILPAYSQGDGIHLNDAGHDILFQRVLAKATFNVTLPATFLQFNTTSKNNSNIISWITAREKEVDLYEIERSADGRSFSTIARVSANNGQGTNQYQYTDLQPLSTVNYYRIIIVDKDGKKKASPVMTVRNSSTAAGIVKIFAGSATEVVVSLQQTTPENIQLQVLSNAGSLMGSFSRRAVAGTNTFHLQTPALGNGVYHVRVITGTGSMVSSFIKN